MQLLDEYKVVFIATITLTMPHYR